MKLVPWHYDNYFMVREKDRHNQNLGGAGDDSFWMGGNYISSENNLIYYQPLIKNKYRIVQTKYWPIIILALLNDHAGRPRVLQWLANYHK